jgi:DNA-binding transcriptional regulator of glucitol operon
VQRYFTPRRIGMHVTLLVLLPTFAWLTWWQFQRAYDGNTLSWAYTFEWPLFGGYAIYVWWQLIHDDPTPFTRKRSDAEFGPDGQPLGPEEQPGWALGSGRARRRADRLAEAPIEAEAATPTGAGTMTGAADGGQPTGPVAPQGRTDVDDSADVDDGDEEDPELAEYNRYLADLNAGPDRKRW